MANKNLKKNKKKDAWLIVLSVTLIVAICTGLICLVLYLRRDVVESGEKDDDKAYPEYSDKADVKTEGAYYDTDKTGSGTAVDMSKVEKEIGAYKYEDFAESDKVTDFVALRIQNYGDIVLALRSDIAPATVANFQKLVEKDFYNNTLIHRVKKDVLIQGGIYNMQDEKKETDTVKGEFTQHKFINNLTHIKGVVSMARGSATDRDSASSEFFIIQGTEAGKDFDTLYASFAYVVAGLDVVDKIAQADVEQALVGTEISQPKANIVIKEAFFVEPKENVGLGTETKKEVKTHTLTLIDNTGAPVSNATIKITNTNTDIVYVNGVTDKDGKASFAAPEGNYRLEILNKEGYIYEDRYDFDRGVLEWNITIDKIAE